jgi:hypothetical protein
MALCRTLLCATALGAVLGVARAQAVDAPAARPGDDALTCDQLYAEATAQSQRDQAEREKRNDERRHQTQATTAVVAGATLAGGMGGTGIVAQKTVEAHVSSTLAEAAAPPQRNPRMEHLKQLWTQKRCVVPKK